MPSSRSSAKPIVAHIQADRCGMKLPSLIAFWTRADANSPLRVLSRLITAYTAATAATRGRQ